MKRNTLFSMLFLVCLVAHSQAQAFVGLFVRVGCAYTTYKFVDGLVDGKISQFADKYQDSIVNTIFSFGKGVQTFAMELKNVVAEFFKDESDTYFSNLWTNMLNALDKSVDAAKKEWSDRWSGEVKEPNDSIQDEQKNKQEVVQPIKKEEQSDLKQQEEIENPITIPQEQKALLHGTGS